MTVSALHSWQCGICHHVFSEWRCPRCAERKAARSPAVAVAMGQTVRLTDAEVDAIVLGGPAGAGEQPSITDRDPGDESRSVDRLIIGAEIVIGRARIAALEAENAKLRADLAKWSRSQTVPEGSFW